MVNQAINKCLMPFRKSEKHLRNKTDSSLTASTLPFHDNGFDNYILQCAETLIFPQVQNIKQR